MKYELKIILIQPSNKATIIHEAVYVFEWVAVIAAWWHGRHFEKLVQERLFDVKLIINKV